MFDLPESAILYADSARGVYIPQFFAESVNRYTICLWSSWIADLDILCQGPDSESYWDVWCSVLDNLTLTDPDTGVTYRLYQDGDLWLVPSDWQPEEES
jgi:hypothetical protein